MRAGMLKEIDQHLRRGWHEDVSVRASVLMRVVWWTLVVIFVISLIDLVTSEVLPSHGFSQGQVLNRALIAGAAIAYLGVMVGTIFSGKTAEALRSTFLVWAITISLVLLTVDAAGILMLLVAFPIAAAAIFTISNFQRFVPTPASSLLKGAAFGLLALWSLLLPTIRVIDWPAQVVAFLFMLFSIMGMMAALPAYANHHDPRLRVIARVAGDTNLSAGGLAYFILVLTYVLVFRTALQDLAPDQLFLADWGVLASAALVAWFIYRYLHRELLKERVSSELFEMQYRAMARMGEMAQVVQAMKEFVELGDKEKLVVMMTRSLLAAGLTEAQTARAIRDLVRFRNEPPSIWVRWLVGDVRSSMEQSRCRAISMSLDNLESVLASRNAPTSKSKE